MTSKKIKETDLVELYDMLQSQLVEDREAIVNLYNDLKSKVVAKDDYVLNGQNLAKYAELMSKCTAQLIEIIKINKERTYREDELSEDDVHGVYKELEK